MSTIILRLDHRKCDLLWGWHWTLWQDNEFMTIANAPLTASGGGGYAHTRNGAIRKANKFLKRYRKNPSLPGPEFLTITDIAEGPKEFVETQQRHEPIIIQEAPTQTSWPHRAS